MISKVWRDRDYFIKDLYNIWFFNKVWFVCMIIIKMEDYVIVWDILFNLLVF